VIEFFLFLAAVSSIAITLGIVGILLYESEQFFRHVSLLDFLTDTQWTVLFAEPRYGIMPLVSGTLVTSITALVVALPLGTVIAIYLSEYASNRVREILKPILELLSAVPTVVFGYFALLFLTPLLQKFLPDLPGFNMLSAGMIIGIMIIPYVSSLSEDAIKAVPVTIREGSYAMGATRLQTALRVLVPSAFSGIASAYVLGFSRAVGETMIVAIAAGQQPNLTLNPMEGAATITTYIVQVSLGDLPHGSIAYQSIFAAGLVLMLMTLAFNIGGYFLRKKFREIYE
jgi:phosphate transport system permease protein